MDNNKKEKEMKIPVFSVLKKGNILKHIFLNSQPPQEQEDDDPILIGRHPDCHIILDHPSVSRYHLELCFNPSARKISVTDLSSVHGTWVSGTRIEPHVPVDLIDGDTMKIGASTRVYRFQWVSMERVLEMAQPLSALPEEKEESLQDANVEESVNPSSEGSFALDSQGDIGGGTEKNLEDSGCSSFSFEIPMRESSLKEIEGSSERRESVRSLRIPAEKGGTEGRVAYEGSDKDTEVEFAKEFQICRVLFASLDSEEEEEGEGEDVMKSSMTNDEEVLDLGEEFYCDEENRPPEVDTGSKSNDLVSDDLSEYDSDKENLASETFIEGEDTVLEVSGGLNCKKFISDNTAFEFPGVAPIFGNCVSNKMGEEKSSYCAPDVMKYIDSKKSIAMNYENSTREDEKSAPNSQDSPTGLLTVPSNARLNLNSEGDAFQWASDISQGLNLNNSILSKGESDQKSGKSCKSMQQSSLNAIASIKAEVICANVPKRTNEITRDKKLKEFILRNGVTKEKEEDEESFPSHKENITPDSSQVLRPKKPFFEIETSGERIIVNSVESHGERTVDKRTMSFKSRGIDKSKNILMQPKKPMHRKFGREKKKWYIVVDTGCFLDAESIKSLQLLEGLRGTCLIIPRIVIRELDLMKRRGRWFGKATKVSSALKWIEECMAKPKKWIHVQKLSESMVMASSPPRSLPAGRSSESKSSMTFLTAEDCILDIALFHRATETDGRLVLLSNSITLKIRAMAEGLLCETPTEFRDSLVNPYSKRFLFRESCPRGSTWSWSDQIDLIGGGNYRNQWLKINKTTKVAERMKGLKFIPTLIRHNANCSR